jgi:hypothetical protein
MSQSEHDEMPTRIDFKGGVRGALFARYQRWAGITTARGPMTPGVLSTGETPLGTIEWDLSRYYTWSVVEAQAPRTFALEVSGRAQR